MLGVQYRQPPSHFDDILIYKLLFCTLTIASRGFRTCIPCVCNLHFAPHFEILDSLDGSETIQSMASSIIQRNNNGRRTMRYDWIQWVNIVIYSRLNGNVRSLTSTVDNDIDDDEEAIFIDIDFLICATLWIFMSSHLRKKRGEKSPIHH